MRHLMVLFAAAAIGEVQAGQGTAMPAAWGS